MTKALTTHWQVGQGSALMSAIGGLTFVDIDLAACDLGAGSDAQAVSE